MSTAPLSGGDLAVTSSSLGNPPFAELVDVAASAGFAALSIWPSHDHVRGHHDGLSDRQMVALLDRAAMRVTTVDCTVVWAGSDDPGGPYFEEPPLEELLEAAEAFGARLANMLVIGQRGVRMEEAAKAVAARCDELAEHGLSAMIEFCAGTLARDLERARTIVDLAGSENLGLLVDTWHVHFGAAQPSGLATTPPGLFLGLQLNDGPEERPADYAHATRYRRLAPGEGAADLVGIIRALRSAGAHCPVTVEVFDQERLERMGRQRWAELLATSARRTLEQADD